MCPYSGGLSEVTISCDLFSPVFLDFFWAGVFKCLPDPWLLRVARALSRVPGSTFGPRVADTNKYQKILDLLTLLPCAIPLPL
jgi:hypothetical protein